LQTAGSSNWQVPPTQLVKVVQGAPLPEVQAPPCGIFAMHVRVSPLVTHARFVSHFTPCAAQAAPTAATV
jgi:hypothetical protein